MAVAAVSSLTVKDSTATTATLSALTDPNNSSRLAQKVGIDSALCTGAVYSYGSGLVNTDDACTDIVTLKGSATKTVRLVRVGISLKYASAAADLLVSLVKRTAANTAGTSAAKTPAKYDSSDAAASAVITEYSANATGLGTGIIISEKFICNSAAGVGMGNIEWDFTHPHVKPLILRGVTEWLAINLNAATIGDVISYSLTWIEDAG